MRKLTSCCIATTALLALTLSAHASPGSTMARAASLYSALGVGPVILVVDENDIKKKKARRARAEGQKQQQMMQQMMQQVPAEYQQYIPQGMGGGQGGGGTGGGAMGGGVKY
jgi:hypothetical protein